MVLGRAVLDERWRTWWRPACVIAGTTLFTTAILVNSAATSPRTRFVLSIDPWERGLAYTASALGTALLAFAGVTWLVDRYPAAPAVDALARAGRTSLSIYVAHALVFNLVVDWLGWVDPGGVGTALAASAVFWTLAIAGAVWWTRRYGTGPLERVYRDLTR
jgi:uncharacterized membrane protein YeiB